jgi:hypothetical protein
MKALVSTIEVCDFCASAVANSGAISLLVLFGFGPQGRGGWGQI